MNAPLIIDRRALAVIFILALLVFLNSLFVPFQWDGIEFVVDNPIIHDMGNFSDPSKASEYRWYGAFKSRYVGYMSFAINYALHGTRPFGYHLFNVLVHALTSMLVYVLALYLFLTPLLRQSRLADKAGSIALWAALIFAVHPVQSEAVTYIFQRHASLVGLFYIGSIVGYLKYKNEGSLKWYALCIISALLAMKTKENAFTLPLMIVFIEAVFYSGHDRDNKKTFFMLLPVLLTMAVVPVTLYALGRPMAEAISGLGQSARDYVMLEGGGREYLLTQVRVVATYLRLFVYPVNQNIDYDYPLHDEAGGVAFISAAFLHLTLIASASFMIIRSFRIPPQSLQGDNKGSLGSLVGFGILWFYLALAVESSVIEIPMLINEYRMYVPITGLVIAVSVVLHMALRGRVLKAALLIIVAVLSIMLVQRNHIWQDSVSLWADTAGKSPDKARPWYNLGVFTELGGDPLGALEHYKKAIALSPEHLDAHYNSGVTLYGLGRLNEAKRAYERVMELAPNHSNALNNLGVTYEKLNELDLAADAYKRSLKLLPDSVEPRLNLGAVLVRAEEYEEAIKVIEEAVKLGANTASAYEDLGLGYFKLGQYDAAIRAYRKAVALAPLNEKTLFNLGTVSLKRGEAMQAEAQFRNALEIRGDYPEAHMGLAAALEVLGRYEEALLSYEAAVKYSYENPLAHFRLGTFHDLRGEKEKAIEHYTKSIELDPEQSNALNNLATIFSERGELERARDFLERAIRANPDNPDAHNNMGVVYYKLQKHSSALREFETASMLAPGNESYKENLIKLKRALGIRD
jgi:tetratricopeptide (TPR) repeat protein